MPELIPQENDNLKLLGAGGFSSIKEYIEPFYHTGRLHIVQSAKGQYIAVSHEPQLDTHMHNGWIEHPYYVNQWKYITR